MSDPSHRDLVREWAHYDGQGPEAPDLADAGEAWRPPACRVRSPRCPNLADGGRDGLCVWHRAGAPDRSG